MLPILSLTWRKWTLLTGISPLTIGNCVHQLLGHTSYATKTKKKKKGKKEKVTKSTLSGGLKFVPMEELSSISAVVEARRSVKTLPPPTQAIMQNAFLELFRIVKLESVKQVRFFTATSNESEKEYKSFHLLCHKPLVDIFERIFVKGEVIEEKIEMKHLTMEHHEEHIPVNSRLWSDIKPISYSKLNKMIGFFERLRHKNELSRNGSPLVKELKAALGTSVTRLVAFDIEAFEFNSRALLELGAAVFELNLPSDPVVPTITTHHFIMTENKNKKNGRFCENNRGNFCFGKSKTMPTDKVLQWLRHQISQPGTAIVGHNLASDLKFLREARVHGGHKGLDKVLSSVAGSYDTQHIFQQVVMFDSPSKLGFILEYYGVRHDYLHNAGNDAYYTMVALLKMAGIPFVEQTPKRLKTT